MLLDFLSAAYAAMRVVLTIGVLCLRPAQCTNHPLVSVVVAARNNSRGLAVLLDDLAAQTYGGFEIIVVDDRSSDETPELLAERRLRDPHLLPLRVDRVPRGRGPKINALAVGTRAARGELVLLTDSDCRVPPTWVASMAACFAPDVGVVIGITELLAPNNTLFERLQGFDYFAMLALAVGAAALGRPIGGGGANLAYRRAALLDAGGFEAVSGQSADDLKMVERIRALGRWRVAVCAAPEGHAFSAAEPTWRRLVAQRMRWMSGGSDVLGSNLALLCTGAILSMHSNLLFFTPLLLTRRATRRAAARLIAVRLLADLLHLSVTTARIGNPRRLWLLPLWVLVHAPYAVALPFLGAIHRLRASKGRVEH